MDDQNTPSEPVVAEAPVQAPEPASTPAESEFSQPNGSVSTDLPPEAPESPTSDSAPILVEDQNPGLNQPESEVPEPSNEASIPEPIQSVPVQSAPVLAPTPQTPIAPQTQPSAQQDEGNFIHSLLIKAQAKIQSNKQKKLNEIIQLAQKKKIIKNDDVQKLLRVSDATATRYLVKLVQQGHLIRIGSPRDAKYQFVQ